jgi:hypothetical protein
MHFQCDSSIAVRCRNRYEQPLVRDTEGPHCSGPLGEAAQGGHTPPGNPEGILVAVTERVNVVSAGHRADAVAVVAPMVINHQPLYRSASDDGCARNLPSHNHRLLSRSTSPDAQSLAINARQQHDLRARPYPIEGALHRI